MIRGRRARLVQDIRTGGLEAIIRRANAAASRFRWYAGGLLLAGPMVFAASAALSADAGTPPENPVCARMAQAMMKTAATPYSSASIVTAGPTRPAGAVENVTSRTSETIFTGDGLFVKSGEGHWRKIDTSITALQELVRQASSKLEQCRDLGSDKVDGIPVLVLSANLGPETSGTMTKQWVDKDRGVLVQSQADTSNKGGSRHSMIHYKYDSVVAPRL